MKHIHHIIPKYMGGTDDPSNLIELTVEQHALAHKELYEKYGNKEDYLAWKGLEGTIGKEEIISIRCSIGGKKSIEKLKKMKKCVFFNDELRKAAGKKGREVSKQKGSGFYNSSLQSELGKRGGPKNKGFIWINDGTKNIKYTKKIQKEKSIDEFLSENPQFKVGRLQTNETVTCPHCNKSGVKSGMILHHFDNCFIITKKTRKFKMKQTQCPHCNKIGAGSQMKKNHFDNCKFKGDN